MDTSSASSWMIDGLHVVVEWHESLFRFRVTRPGSASIVAEGFATSLEAAREKATRAAAEATLGALVLAS